MASVRPKTLTHVIADTCGVGAGAGKPRGVGTAVIALQSFSATGSGFSVSGPGLTFNIAAGAAADLYVRFSAPRAGSYSGELKANALSLSLSATALAAPNVTAEGDTAGSRIDIAAGTAIYLGLVQKSKRNSRPLWLENRGRDPLEVRRIEITGSTAFVNLGPASASLPAGGSQRIDIEFAPIANAAYAGVLNIDGRAFPLTGVGFDPPLPKPSIRIEGSVVSGQQPKVVIDLAGAAESVEVGTLRMDFRPLGDLPDDPAVRFVSGGGRSVNVQVRQGEAQAVFGSQREAVFQCGTTAGTLNLTLELGAHVLTQSVVLPAAAPALDSTLALRKTQDLEITLIGFDNTRSISQALFTFYDASGRPVSPGTIRTEVRREFDEFFRSSAAVAGGVFTMRASFPVQGGAAARIASVEAELVNSAGSSRTQRMPFP